MDTAVHLCLRKICLAYLDDIKVYVFIKNIHIFNPDECEKPAASKKKKGSYLFWKMHLNLNANKHYCVNCADKIREENNL